MQTTVLALALGSAAAFVGPAAQAPATAVNAGQGDLVALAEANGDQLGRKPSGEHDEISGCKGKWSHARVAAAAGNLGAVRSFQHRFR